MDLMGVDLIIEPILLISGIPGALGKSVTSLLFTETGQDLRSLGSNSAFACCFYEFFSGYCGGARRAASSPWSNGVSTKPTDGGRARRWLGGKIGMTSFCGTPTALG
jgi:hypothetical protein